MVDLIGQPGNFYNPDSSINGDIFSSVSSSFQNPHFKDVQEVPNTLYTGMLCFYCVKL